MNPHLIDAALKTNRSWDFLGACTLEQSQIFPAVFGLIPEKSLKNTATVSESGDWFVAWNPDCNDRVYVAQAGPISVVVIGPPWLSPSLPEKNVAAYIARGLHSNVPLTSLLTQMDNGFLVMTWNDATKIGALATDPIGRFALYYSTSTGQLVWASHPLPVAILSRSEIQLSQEAVNIYFSLKGIPAPWSLLKGVRKLPPGHLISIKKTGIEVKEYFHLETVGTYEGSFLEAQEELIHRLRGSIEKSISNFRHVGVFLSGGLDSTTLTILSCQIAPVLALSIGYAPRYYADESEHAASIARSLGVPIEIHRFLPTDVIALLDKTLAYLPEPVADTALLPQMFLASYASQSVRVVLDGTGADAILGGSNKFVAEHYRHFYVRIPQVVRRGLIYPLVWSLPSSRRWPLTNWIRQLQVFIKGAEILSSEERIFFWSMFFPQAILKKVLSTSWALDRNIGADILRDLIGRCGDQENVSRISYMTLRGITAGVELPKLAAVERVSGLFIHLPFLSNGLVEFALSLPDSYKVSGGHSKLVLREAFKRIAPQSLVQRRKANFSPPAGEWLTGQLRELFWETVAPGEGVFNIDTIRRMWREQHVGWRDWSIELWAIFMFQRWWKHIRKQEEGLWHWNG